MFLDLSDFSARQDRPLRVKMDEFQRERRLKHLIFASQLELEHLNRLQRLADIIRQLSKTKKGSDALRSLLSHKRAMLYFTQPSTRTFLSFMAACQILGLTCNEVRDPATSSEMKRESPLDSIRMFSSYFDIIIMRSPVAGFSECCAYLMNDLEKHEMRSVPIINAGSGSEEHPTQALLDVYTIQRTFQFDSANGVSAGRLPDLNKKFPGLVTGLNNKTYLFCGDLGRGRTVRSLATTLTNYSNVRMFFVSPDHEKLRLDTALRKRLETAGVEFHEFDSLDATFQGQEILSLTDCLYMTRIQIEHNTEADSAAMNQMDLSPYHLSPARLQKLRDYAPILHPFPRDSVVQEIPTIIDSDPRAMYFRQARNGMWVRAALLVHLFNVADQLLFLHNDFYGG
jgi:aspartate carbamoyltransferase catalytic subunit